MSDSQTGPSSGPQGHIHTGDTCDCLKSSHILRIQGDKAFRAKDYMGAIDLYTQAMAAVTEGLQPDKLLYANRCGCVGGGDVVGGGELDW